MASSLVLHRRASNNWQAPKTEKRPHSCVDELVVRVYGLKVSKNNGLLLRNYPSECNKRGLEDPPRDVLGLVRSTARARIIQQPRTTNFFTLTSLAQIWTPQ
ncbi:hypothetical protein TNCV_3958521 [Trichonephila clavipes]|nr:hypothetical protein TNCV_3958521 [Trichonephila clavipes]